MSKTEQKTGVVGKFITRVGDPEDEIENHQIVHYYAIGVVRMDYDTALEDARFLQDKDKIIQALSELGRPWGVV